MSCIGKVCIGHTFLLLSSIFYLNPQMSVLRIVFFFFSFPLLVMLSSLRIYEQVKEFDFMLCGLVILDSDIQDLFYVLKCKPFRNGKELNLKKNVCFSGSSVVYILLPVWPWVGGEAWS